jgi:hypothetical protein
MFFVGLGDPTLDWKLLGFGMGGKQGVKRSRCHVVSSIQLLAE